MINYSHVFKQLNENPKFEKWLKILPQQLEDGLSTKRYGDLLDWYQAYQSLPDVKASSVELKPAVKIGQRKDVSDSDFKKITQAFEQLIPWRKGPYHLFDELFVDTEWRSDWKWERLLSHITPLKNRTVLDVGCGNGYHCLRMSAEGAKYVVGIDPSPRFIVQYYMLKHFMPDVNADVLPLGIEALPENLESFDSTFCMGVFYHRRSPMDHLRELKATLRPGGELILETLVIDGELGECLVPEGRYAQMGNVWFLPSVPTLMSWLTKCGFDNVRCVDINQTTTQEQRATSWMRYQSLPDFLDPNDTDKTIEGHPAPKRAIFIASKRQ